MILKYKFYFTTVSILYLTSFSSHYCNDDVIFIYIYILHIESISELGIPLYFCVCVHFKNEKNKKILNLVFL